MINPVGTTGAAPAPAPSGAARAQQPPDQLKELAQEFETFFLEMILRQNRAAAQALSGTQKSTGRDTYESWQDQSFAKAIATGGGIGLGEMLYRQLQQSQLEDEGKR